MFHLWKRNRGTTEMGYWNVPVSNGVFNSTTGLTWQQWRDGASAPGQIRIDATLYGIPWGVSWENTCKVTTGLLGQVPASCLQRVLE